MPEWNRLSDIHLWDLNANSTRFDQASAAPTDEELQESSVSIVLLCEASVLKSR